MIKNDPKTGKLTGRVPGKSITIVRNPNWDKSTDYRPAYLDGINIEEGNDDLATASRRALNGSDSVCCDAGSPPAPVLKQVVQKQKDQVLFVPSGGTRYIAFDNKVKPFDNINVRKAIIAASDRNALRLTRGGEILGDIATGWIPPGIPGFEEAGGLKQNADLDYLANPSGDPAVSKKYMLAAKQQDPSLPIDANGKWTGGNKILTIATNADPGKKTAEVFQGQIENLGFKLNFRIVPQDTLYTKFCGVRKEEVPICPNVGWFKDFADPQSMLDPTFNGNNILEQGNVNWPAAQRARDQLGHEGRRGRARRGRAQQGVGQDQPHDRRAGPGDPVPLGQDGPGQLQGRRRRRQRVLHDPRPELHLPEVGGHELSQNHT